VFLISTWQNLSVVSWKWFVLVVYKFWKGISAGPALKYFPWFIGAGGEETMKTWNSTHQVLLLSSTNIWNHFPEIFILQNLILRTRLCVAGFITQPSCVLDFHRICQVAMICIGGVPVLKRHFGGAGPSIFYMIHRGRRYWRQTINTFWMTCWMTCNSTHQVTEERLVRWLVGCMWGGLGCPWDWMETRDWHC